MSNKLTRPARAEIPTPVLEQNWNAAEQELRQKFSRVPDTLWYELKGLTLYGDRHRVTEVNDPMVHAYLLSQLFALVVMDTINSHVGMVPVHARLGCVGDGEISGISIKVGGIDDVDLKAIEDDFFAHVDAEENKENAVKQLLH